MKIDLGVQIDGYIAMVAHTIVVGDGPITGRQADVLLATYTASQLAMRLIKVGAKNTQITEMIQKVAADFNVVPMQGVLSHKTSRFVVDGEKCIIGNDKDKDHKVDEFEFEANEVFCMDLVFSTGEGKPKETEDRVTVYKKVPDATYSLKMKASRQVISEISTKFATFPFGIRSVTDSPVRFGIVECKEHNLVTPFPILKEKDGEFVAQMKFSVFVTPNGPVKITGIPLNEENITSGLYLSLDLTTIPSWFLFFCFSTLFVFLLSSFSPCSFLVLCTVPFSFRICSEGRGARRVVRIRY